MVQEEQVYLVRLRLLGLLDAIGMNSDLNKGGVWKTSPWGCRRVRHDLVIKQQQKKNA